ncbi:MAG: hypothetical protein HS117_19455 [Verrucomicrobiaceae bacterium]|nr:hypothetical protein [Verrucomicrobiaceae bacterium]
MEERLRALAKAVNTIRGPGWLLVMLETMMAEWGWSLEKAVFEGPLTACQALWPAMLHRHGCEVHGTHADKARQAAKAAKRAEIEAAFTIRRATPKEIIEFQRSLAAKRK